MDWNNRFDSAPVILDMSKALGESPGFQGRIRDEIVEQIHDLNLDDHCDEGGTYGLLPLVAVKSIDYPLGAVDVRFAVDFQEEVRHFGGEYTSSESRHVDFAMRIDRRTGKAHVVGV